MTQKYLRFSGEELDDERLEHIFEDEVRQGLQELYHDAKQTDWFTELCLHVPVNRHGVNSPRLLLGINRDANETGVETYDVLDKVKANEYPGITYDYYDDGTVVGLAMVLTPSHIPNYDIDAEYLLDAS